jgi:hypothetical protein
VIKGIKDGIKIHGYNGRGIRRRRRRRNKQTRVDLSPTL